MRLAIAIAATAIIALAIVQFEEVQRKKSARAKFMKQSEEFAFCMNSHLDTAGAGVAPGEEGYLDWVFSEERQKREARLKLIGSIIFAYGTPENGIRWISNNAPEIMNNPPLRFEWVEYCHKISKSWN